MYIQVNDTRLFFDVDGIKLSEDGDGLVERPTLIVLHGGPGFDHAFFGNDHSSLRDVAQIVYVEFRGNGLSDRSAPDRLTLDQWTDDIAEFIDTLGIEKPVLLGFSFGGFIAIKLAARYPNKISKLILVSTLAKVVMERSIEMFGHLGGSEAREAASDLFSAGGVDVQKRFFEICIPLYWARSPRLDRFSRSNGPVELFDHLIEHIIPIMDLDAEVRAIQCPTLVISGSEDPITTPDDMDDLAAAIPGTLLTFERIAGARHFIADDAPETYFDLIGRFISS